MKRIFSVLFLLGSFCSFSQQLEVGPSLKFDSSNIVDSRVSRGRAVIGKALWKTSVGFSVTYYFKNPTQEMSSGINFDYYKGKRGSVSEEISGNKYEINTESFNLSYRIAGNLEQNFRWYADLGFGYNILDNTDYYRGNADELSAFPKLREPLVIKNNEATFIFGLGFEKVFAERFVAFINFNGDAGISKINKNGGSFRTQSLGFGAGAKYIISFKKK